MNEIVKEETKVVTTPEIKVQKESKARKYDFKDVKGVVIPNKIKCSKCGREVSGYGPLVYERVMKQFNGEWNRYLKEWKCGDCKRVETEALKGELNKGKREKQIQEAIKLLETEGFKVQKKVEKK